MTEETTKLAVIDSNTTTETTVVDMTGAAPSKPEGVSRRLLTNSVSKKGPSIYTWAVANAQDRCPFATNLCASVCYAKGGQFTFHWARYRENYELAQRPDFPDLMCAEIEVLHAQRHGRATAIALHEKGDFFSSQYLDSWRTIMARTARLDGLRYFVYTRSWVNPVFRAALERIGAECPHVRINLSLDRENCEHGAPARIGHGMLAYLTERDDDVPVVPVDIVFRNLRLPKGEPLEKIGGFTVCPHEAQMFVARNADGAAAVRKGKLAPIRCQECLLCISRGFRDWEAVKAFYLGSPGQQPVAPATIPMDTTATIIVPDADPKTQNMDAIKERNPDMDAPHNSMRVHPLLDLVPMMPEREISELTDDVRINGQRDDILTFRGQIVDGRALWLACLRAGVTPRVREWDGDGDVAHFIWSRNITRRNLTASQRAMLVIALKPHMDREAKKRMSKGGMMRVLAAKGVEIIPTPDQGKVRDKLAEQAGVNPHYVSDAARIQKQSPELVPDIRDGKITIPEALRLITPTPEPQPSGTAAVVAATTSNDARTAVTNSDAGGTASETLVSPVPPPEAATTVAVNGDGGPALHGERVGETTSDTIVSVAPAAATTNTAVNGTSHGNKKGGNPDPDDIKRAWGAFRRLAHRLADDDQNDHDGAKLLDLMRALAATTEKLSMGLARRPLSAPTANAVRAQAARLRAVLAITGKRPADAALVSATATPPVLPKQDELFLRHVDKVARIYTRAVTMVAKRMDWIVRVYGDQFTAEAAITRMCESNTVPFRVEGMMAAWNTWSIKRQHRLATGGDAQLTDVQWSALTPLVKIDDIDVQGRLVATCAAKIASDRLTQAEINQLVADLVFDARNPAPPLEEDANCLGDGEEDAGASIAVAAADAVENAS